jgi:hypothetical protein
MEKEYLSSIDNFVTAVINTRFLDEQEMWDQLWAYAEAKVNRMRALDPQRNR